MEVYRFVISEVFMKRVIFLSLILCSIIKAGDSSPKVIQDGSGVAPNHRLTLDERSLEDTNNPEELLERHKDSASRGVFTSEDAIKIIAKAFEGNEEAFKEADEAFVAFVKEQQEARKSE